MAAFARSLYAFPCVAFYANTLDNRARIEKLKIDAG